MDLSFRLAEGGQLAGGTEAGVSVWKGSWVLTLRLPPGKQAVTDPLMEIRLCSPEKLR